MEGSSSLLICCLTMTSNAVVPTKSDGVEPWNKWKWCKLLITGNSPETYGRVVQNGSNIAIFDLIERIDALDTIVKQLVEDETYTGTTRQFVQRQIVGRTVDSRSKL